MKISLRYKILAVIAFVLLAATGTYHWLAARLLTLDKMQYIYWLNGELAGSLSAQTQSNVDVLMKEVLLFVREARVDKTAASEFLAGERDWVRVELYERHGDVWALAQSHVNHDAMASMHLHDADLPLLRKERPLPLGAMGAARDAVHVQNSSLPPEAAVLTLAFHVNDDTLVAVDFSHQRLLRLFDGSKQHLTYLLDERGIVVAHPDSQLVLKHADMSRMPLVKAALTAEFSQGLQEFTDDDRTEQIGAWARVPLGHLTVVTQIPKEVLLRPAKALLKTSAVFGVIVVLGAFIVSIFFSRLLTAPLRALTDAARKIGAGHLDVDVQVHSRDEIGELAEAFRAMAKALRDAGAQLVQSEKMSAFGQLGAGITHEVKNPLTNIIGFTQLAQRTEDSTKVRELLGVVEQESARCLKIVTSFLKFARASSGDKVSLDINEVLDEVTRVLKHQMSVHNVELFVTRGEGIPAVLGNGAELQQVLLNLAINAQQAMPRGGRVDIASRRDPFGGAVLTVQDTGPGIAESLRTKIFEPFFTTKPAGEGTGLGLSVSFSIIQAHKGTIEVASEPGRGATFTIWLPAA